MFARSLVERQRKSEGESRRERKRRSEHVDFRFTGLFRTWSIDDGDENGIEATGRKKLLTASNPGISTRSAYKVANDARFVFIFARERYDPSPWRNFARRRQDNSERDAARDESIFLGRKRKARGQWRERKIEPRKIKPLTTTSAYFRQTGKIKLETTWGKRSVERDNERTEGALIDKKNFWFLEPNLFRQRQKNSLVDEKFFRRPQNAFSLQKKKDYENTANYKKY